MRLSFDDGTLLLEDAPGTVPYAEWDDRVDEYRARAQHYRAIRGWANDTDGQATLKESTATVVELEDDARSYSEFHLTPSVAIEPRDYQQEALSAWQDNDRQGSVVLPTGSGKTFLAVQAIADAGVSALVVVPTIDLLNQWHATLTNAFGDQLPDGVGVLGGGSHNITDITVTTYDSAYRYINEYGDQFGLLVVDEVHHLPAPTYQQIPEMTIAPYRLGLTATYERADGAHEALEELPQQFLSDYGVEAGSVEETYIFQAIKERMHRHLRAGVERVFSRLKSFTGLDRVRARKENNVETHVVLSAVALVAASLTAKRHDKPGLIRSPSRLI